MTRPGDGFDGMQSMDIPAMEQSMDIPSHDPSMEPRGVSDAHRAGALSDSTDLNESTEPDGRQMTPPADADLPPEATLSHRPNSRAAHTAGDPGDSVPGQTGPAYIVRELVGTGGHGEVHAAVQSSLGRIVAVKRLRADLYEDAKEDPAEIRWLEKFFRREAVATALLEHPNIVPIHTYSQEAGGRPLLAMKLVRGKGWDLLIQEDLPLPLADFLAKHLPILIDVGHAVAFAHSRGIVHRDLKPQQVMVGEFGEVLLMDWGLALVSDPALVEAHAGGEAPHWRQLPTNLTGENPAGSPAFMAPEQTEPVTERIGPLTDVFLLGATLYYMLTGTPPHRLTGCKTPADMFARAALCEIQTPEERSADAHLPAELSALAMKAMARDPADRVPDAKTFVEAVQDYLSGAGRRRESRTLARQAAEAFGGRTAGSGYSELSACDSLLERALALWPDNREATRLRRRVLTEYAQAALANEDLTLARVQGERLPRGEERDDVMREIAVLERLMERAGDEAVEAEMFRRGAEEERAALSARIAELETELAAARRG